MFRLIFVLILMIGVESKVECPIKGSGFGLKFYSRSDTAMREELNIHETGNVTSEACSKMCLQNLDCMSYLYSYDDMRCLLFPYDSETGPEFLVYHEYPGYLYYDRIPTLERQIKMKKRLGKCEDNGCLNGASCREDCSDRGYYCDCATGFRGPFCATTYFNEPRLVQEIPTGIVRSSVGFTFNNEHYFVVGGWLDHDENGDAIQAEHVIYKFNKDTDEYDFFQFIYYGGKTMKYNAFEINGKMYLYQANYESYGSGRKTNSRIYVLEGDSKEQVEDDDYDYQYTNESLANETAVENFDECYSDLRARYYLGGVSTTRTGRTCQMWTVQSTHTHSFDEDDSGQYGFGDHNYCRNVGGNSDTAWCYTTDPDVRWEYCDVGDPKECGNCTFTRGVSNGILRDELMTSSSYYNNDYHPYYGRLDYSGSWIASSNDANQWIAVDLDYMQYVTAVVTQGRESNNQYVKTFEVHHGYDGTTWDSVRNADNEMTFTGNSDDSNPVVNYFYTKLYTQHIKISPKSWNSHICMRIDVLGCDVETPFKHHQTLPTQGAWGSSFIRDSSGHPYFFVTNKRGDAYNINSQMYKWYTRYDRFISITDISTEGATDPVMFDIEGVLYVAIPFNYGDGSQYGAQSGIWKRTETYDFIGCYLDSAEDRAMKGDMRESSSNDVESCIAYCRELGHPFAGMEAASYCYCGDENYAYFEQRADGECNQACAGDGSEYCGADLRLSVYRTEPTWEKLQGLSGTEDGGGATSASYFEKNGLHYVVINRYLDDSSCNHNVLVYVYDPSGGDFDLHQSFANTGCFMEVEVFEVGGSIFLIAATNKQIKDASDIAVYNAENTVYKLEGTKFVKYWRSLMGRASWDWSVFWRDEELYLSQSNARGANNTHENEFLKIYTWE